MITQEGTLADVCFAVSHALEMHGITAVLTGGSAASVYAPHVYASHDADFALGRGDYVHETATLTKGDMALRILSPTDCVRDRLAHFYHWDDFTALKAAVGVAAANVDKINMDLLRSWSKREENIDKFDEFERRLRLVRSA